jgi:lysophospholipase L1-like esterase
LENGRYVVDHSWEQRLSEDFGLTIRNRSRFGSTIQKAMALIRRDAQTPPEEPEIAVLEFGGNDCDYDWAAISEHPEAAYDCKTPPPLFLERYREAVELLRRSGRTPVILNLPPIHSGRYLDSICRNGLNRENILRWLGDVEAISRWQEQYSAMTERLAREKGAPLIDLRGAFPAGGDALAELTCADGIHPSRAGQGRIYRRLCECL